MLRDVTTAPSARNMGNLNARSHPALERRGFFLPFHCALQPNAKLQHPGFRPGLHVCEHGQHLEVKVSTNPMGVRVSEAQGLPPQGGLKEAWSKARADEQNGWEA